MRPDNVQGKNLYSIRMHASSDEGHLCGAERIIPKALIPLVSKVLVNRVLNRETRGFDSIHLRVDLVDSNRLRKIPLLPIRTVQALDPDSAGREAERLLSSAGVSYHAAGNAIQTICSGASPRGGNMRGGMIIHAQKGERLEPDRWRGVRVSRVDLAEEVREDLQRFLKSRGLGHHRILEAAVLASKVASIPRVVAEFCMSDDPGYTTGYVASPRFGYVRIHNMKPAGSPFGGRAFFVEGDQSVQGIVEEMQEVPYLVSEFSEV